MGREIRRVPPNWAHPRYTADDTSDHRRIGQYKSLYDEDYETAAAEWITNFELWQRGEHPSQPCDYCKFYWEYDTPPNEEHHRPKFAAEPTWYQVYETVSEGSPVTPPFASQDELINYLVNVGEMAGTQYNRKYSRPAAEKFVRETGWAPSMIVETFADGRAPKIREGAEALL